MIVSRGPASGVEWTKDGREVVVTEDELSFFDARTGERTFHLEEPFYGINRFPVDREKGGVLVVPQYEPMQLFDRSTGTRTLLGVERVVYPTAAATSPDGRAIAITDRAGLLRVHEWGIWGQRFLVQAHRDAALCLDWHPTNERIAVSGEDGTVRVFDAANGELLSSLNAHRTSIQNLRWSPSGERLASVGMSGDVVIWNVSGVDSIRSLVPSNASGFENRGYLAWDQSKGLL